MPRKKDGEASPPASKAKPAAAGKKTAAPRGKPPAVKSAGEVPLYLMKIQLKGLRPPVWRTFFIPSDITLMQLGFVIEDVMGWSGGHLHEFDIYGDTYQDHTFPDAEGQDESKHRLNSFGFGRNSKFLYVYDFGDWWEHELTVMDTDYLPKDSKQRVGCLDGKRACPPDDCGGPPGYKDLLAILAAPGHPEHETMKEWVEEVAGEDFDPEYFSVEEMDGELRSYRYS
ncbi:MAG: plasmid pRiA4b ORF-3 family protein [Deltaproteobacteria bacterium]|jgi:hypothetical protein|nr:plasmid pRiA4b ORF-3 family protein [Deltaproteobacteria bacterium]